jgi:RHS repeat-associated protein
MPLCGKKRRGNFCGFATGKNKIKMLDGSVSNLINMNGRMYDPVLARFLSPAPFVQAPDFSQNYNRYTYCLNNPLKFTDPSGEIVWFIPVIIGAVVGAYTGASIQSGTAAFWNWKPDAWKGAIAGATLGYGVSGAIGASGMTTVAANGATVATK